MKAKNTKNKRKKKVGSIYDGNKLKSKIFLLLKVNSIEAKA